LGSDPGLGLQRLGGGRLTLSVAEVRTVLAVRTMVRPVLAALPATLLRPAGTVDAVMIDDLLAFGHDWLPFR